MKIDKCCSPSALLASSHTVMMQSAVAAAKRAPELDRAMQLKSERSVRNMYVFGH